MRPSSCNDARLTFYMMLKCIYTLVTLHKSKLPECIYTEGHIAFIPGRFALKHMYMLYCTFVMSDCISQMLEFHFGNLWSAVDWQTRKRHNQAAELLMSVLYIFELYLQHTCRAADECTVWSTLNSVSAALRLWLHKHENSGTDNKEEPQSID